MPDDDFVDPAAATQRSDAGWGDSPEPIQRTGRYTSEDQHAVGRGSGGTVVATRDSVLRRRVAVKRLRSDAEAAFINEARIAAQLDHPAIGSVFDLFRDPTGTLCVAMRLVEGESLGQRLQRAKSLDERLRLMPAMLQVAQALAYAHRRGVVHLDLKPPNVMLGSDGQTSVIDWGLARALERAEDAVDVSGGLALGSAGTPAYWSPEQANGLPPDKRSDVWGLGAILFELLTGRAPWVAPSVVEVVALARTSPPPRVEALVPEAPVELVAICKKAMRREPDERYPTAIEFAADLEAWFDGRAISARRRNWREQLSAFVRRNPWPVAAVAFAFACVVVSAWLVTARVREERDEVQKLSRVFGQAASRGIEPRPENERLLTAYTEASERYFARLGSDVTDADRINLALAWDRLSRIHMRLGKYELSWTEAQRSLSLSKPIVAAHPEDGAAQEAMVGALIILGSLAQVQGKAPDVVVSLRTEALVAADAAAARDEANPVWIEMRALSLTRWLYDVSESIAVPPERLAQATALSDLAERGTAVKPRTAMLLDTWLMEERWRRGELNEARRHAAQVDELATRVLEQEPTSESRGLAMYSLLMAGSVSAWSRDPERALGFWRRVEQVAAQVDLKRSGNRTLVFERARAWLAMGRVAEAREDLRQLVKEGFPVVAVEHLAALLLQEPLSAHPAPEDALDALVLGLFALREGQVQEAAKRLLDARAKGVSRQLFSSPGMMAGAVAGVPEPLAGACDQFAKAWDDAVARGDVPATDRAIEALAAALTHPR